MHGCHETAAARFPQASTLPHRFPMLSHWQSQKHVGENNRSGHGQMPLKPRPDSPGPSNGAQNRDSTGLPWPRCPPDTGLSACVLSANSAAAGWPSARAASDPRRQTCGDAPPAGWPPAAVCSCQNDTRCPKRTTEEKGVSLVASFFFHQHAMFFPKRN